MQLTRWILTGLAFAGTGAVGAAMLFYFAHHQSEHESAETAKVEFDQIRARFAGETPLLDMQQRRASVDQYQQERSAPLHTFHAIIFDTRGGERIVRLKMPYHFARFIGRGGFRWLGQLTFLDDTEFDPEPIQLSLDELARHGPGLLVDYRHASGGQFISWVE